MTTANARWRTQGIPGTIAVGLMLGLLAFAIFGPLANLVLWAFAERWYFPNKIPSEFGFSFWGRVFSARGGAVASLGTSVWIAVLTVIVSLAVAIPAGYALARVKLRWRGLILLAFLLPQAVPNIPVYVNIARVFYELGLAGTIRASFWCMLRTAWCSPYGSPPRRSRRSIPHLRKRPATSGRRR